MLIFLERNTCYAHIGGFIRLGTWKYVFKIIIHKIFTKKISSPPKAKWAGEKVDPHVTESG